MPALLAALLGCGDDKADARDPNVEPEGPTVLPTVRDEWRACPVTPVDGSECRLFAVPVDHSKPTGAQLDVHVRRFKAKVQPARGSVWLLQGGPGGSGASLAFLAPDFQAALPDHDVVLLDHRGTGKSAPLRCPKQESAESTDGLTIAPEEAKACVTAAEASTGVGSARHFTTTAAARDLGAVIEAAGAKRNVIWSVSYGTFWAQRYLHLFPKQADAVVLDSVVAPKASFDRSAVDTDTAASAVLARCGEDAFCAGKLGKDPRARLVALKSKIDETQHCKDAVSSSEELASLLAQMSTFPTYLRTLMAPVIYRIERCSEADLTALEGLSRLFASDSEDDFSLVTRFHIGLSELYTDPPPSAAAMEKELNGLAIALPSLLEERALFDVWPRYSRDAYYGKVPNPTTPVLLINGTLDGQTPATGARTLAAAMSQAQYVEIVDGNHGVFSDSTCAQEIETAFMTDPSKKLDTSCAKDGTVLDFKLSAVSGLFGGDTWENPSGTTSSAAIARPLRLVLPRTRRVPTFATWARARAR